MRSLPAINTNVHVPGARQDAELQGRKTVAWQSYTGILIKLKLAMGTSVLSLVCSVCECSLVPVL